MNTLREKLAKQGKPVSLVVTSEEFPQNAAEALNLLRMGALKIIVLLINLSSKQPISFSLEDMENHFFDYLTALKSKDEIILSQVIRSEITQSIIEIRLQK